MPRIGLVLGAGGIVGHAFHAGVLSAIHERTGWDARDAEVVIGTSAGSIVGALLRGGLGPADLAARAMNRPMTPEGQELVARVGASPPMGFPRPDGPRTNRPAAPAAFLNAARRPWRARPGPLAAAALPAGRVPTEQVVAGIRPFFRDGRWPGEDLWIVAGRLSDGRRTVFGREGAPVTDVTTAVAASCAIPGYFSPVEIAGERYVDGGVHSPTNLDLLAGRGLDLIVVSSSLSAAGGRARRAIDLPVRRVARGLLRAEAARVRLQGTPVLTFEPTPQDQLEMGPNAMDPRRRGRVTRAAFASASERLGRPDVRERLDVLAAVAQR